MKEIAPLAGPAPRRFVASRFLALVRVDWAERKRSYYAFAAVMLVVQLLWLGVFVAGAHQMEPFEKKTLMALYYSWLLVFLAAFCCVLFAPLQRQDAALLALVRPASTWEKWLHSVLMLLVAMPLLYTLVFELVYVSANAVAASAEAARHARLIALGQPPSTPPTGFQWFVPLLWPGSRNLLLAQLVYGWMVLMVAGFGAFCLVQFKRSAAIKALGLAVVLVLCTALLLSVGHGDPSVLLELGQPPGLRRTGWGAWLAQGLFWGLCPAVLWLASYLAWRERDLA